MYWFNQSNPFILKNQPLQFQSKNQPDYIYNHKSIKNKNQIKHGITSSILTNRTGKENKPIILTLSECVTVCLDFREDYPTSCRWLGRSPTDLAFDGAS